MQANGYLDCLDFYSNSTIILLVQWQQYNHKVPRTQDHHQSAQPLVAPFTPALMTYLPKTMLRLVPVPLAYPAIERQTPHKGYFQAIDRT